MRNIVFILLSLFLLYVVIASIDHGINNKQTSEPESNYFEQMATIQDSLYNDSIKNPCRDTVHFTNETDDVITAIKVKKHI